jgi:hypothetical protein
MFDDEDTTRRALRTLTDEPAPPVATSLDHVLRRGRRRVFAQRASAVAGVVAVVAAIGVTAVLLRPGGGDQVHVADQTTPAPPSSASTRTPPLPGWTLVEIPANCHDNVDPGLPGEPQIPLLPKEVVEPALTSSVDTATGHPAMIVSSNWMGNSPKHDAPRGYVQVEIPVAGTDGNGQVQLEVTRFGGTPDQAANADVGTYGDCEPPARHVLADGTVLQLYPVSENEPQIPTQHLQIFQPGGREYILTSAGYGVADLQPVGGGSFSVASGRGKLPTTEAQLADIALGMVAKLTAR